MRHAVRLVRRSPGFTALCVLTLGLSIGATTAIFSVVNPVLLRSLPYPDADRLVMVWERDADGAPSNTTFATYSDLAARAHSIERAAALGGWQPTLSEPGNAERVQGARVSWSYFRVLGVRPAIGRDFVEAEDNRGAELAVILSHGLWMRRYGGDRSIVGRAIPIDGAPHNVVGVLPPSFDNVLSPNAQIWRVLRYEASSPSACRTCRHLRMVARLRPEVTREQAAAELDRLSGVLVREHPRDYPAAGMHVVRLQEQVTRSLRPVLFAVVGATALVLLIAIANVTNLQLARAMRREGEFALRSALGAGRGRLVQQLLAEGLLVAALGGVAGVLVAVGALPALLARLPQELPRLMPIGRLDMTSEGLLLLTNDGELKRRLELPATGWLRRYRVRVHGRVDEGMLDALKNGIMLDGFQYGPIQARLDRVQGSNAWLTVALREGKNREIRRVLEHFGWPVNRLIRLSFGPFQLGGLAPGAIEEVPAKVLAEQLGTRPGSVARGRSSPRNR
jgi:predicted permease